MKITIISPAYPLRGGIAHSTTILYHKLTESKHQVNIISFKRQYPKLLFPGQSQFETSGNESFKVANEPVVDSLSPISWFKAYKKVKSYRPDLLIVRYWMPFFAPCLGTICWLVKRFTETKILYICDNIIPHEKRLGDIGLTKYALNRSDFFILLSDYVKKDLLNLVPRAVFRVIPHPVLEIFGDRIDKQAAKKEIGISDEKVILYFGLVRAYKGLDLLLKALPAILKKLPVKVLVAGEFYEDEAKYRSLIRELNIEDNIVIHNNFVENQQVSTYFSAADVLVLPYKTATQSGIVQLAYQFDRPCIVTDVGGLSEVVIHEKTGYVVEPNNPDAIAQAVIKFYAENREREFSENVNKEKRKYSWDNMVSAIEEFIQ